MAKAKNMAAEPDWSEVEESGPEQKALIQARVVSAKEILEMTLPKTEFAIEPIVSSPGVWLVVGEQKAGKSLFAAQMALSMQAPEPLMGWYSIPRARAAMFIEQDDPSQLAAIQPILQRTKIPIRPDGFFSVEKAMFTIEPGFIEFLEGEIRGRALGVIVLDSYTVMRGPRNGRTDIVKAEALDLGMLDELAKRTGCLILVIHHVSKGSASLDWSDRSAGTYAMGAHSEGQIFISCFRDLPSNAPERLVQIRGRHVAGIEMVIRFEEETLSHSFIFEGAAAAMYPMLQQINSTFGGRTFSPKSLCQETGMSRASVHRVIARLSASGILRKRGFGEYVIERVL